jgi:hypothetical protein
MSNVIRNFQPRLAVAARITASSREIFATIVREIDALHAGLFLSAALFCQGFFSPKRYARRDRARNYIAYFPRWSDQQAKFAEDQEGLFEVGCSGRLGHRFFGC